MRTGALICAPDDEDDDCRGADEDDCRGAACCAPSVPTTTMVALRTPTTFWNCRTRFCAALSSASISHVNRHTPAPRRSWRIDREVANRHVAPPQDAAHTAQRQQVAGQQDGDCAAAGAHVEAGAASSGSESEPPGTIIGNTLASCSLTSSTSVGPGVSFAWRNASLTSLASFTRQPGMPYASASLT